MEKKLNQLFDYQRFEKNKRLDRVIRQVESDFAMQLSDESLSFVNAAGPGNYDLDRYSYWYNKFNVVLGLGISHDEIENRLREMIEEIESDNLLEPTDKSFLIEQIKSFLL